MNISELIPTPLHKTLFHIRDLMFIPKLSGCYVLTTFNNEILYIGLTKNLFKRFQQHIADPEKLKITENGKAAWFYYLTTDELEIHKIERTWINEFQRQHGNLPILNKIQSPIVN